MTMRIEPVAQGSAAWHALRSTHFNASEAPAMMAVSPYQSRSDLLRAKKTGIAAEVDAGTQRRFDNGHATEAAARPIAEELLGEDLYPVVGTLDLDGLPLLASMDGVTIDDKTCFEHKAFNADTVKHIQLFGEPPIHHVWQLEHQLLVAAAERVLFMCSDGTRENAVFCTYVSQPERRAALIAGWRQFAADLAAYVPPTPAAVEKLVADPVEALPAPVVQVTGELALTDNFKVFEQRLRAFLADKLIREPKTDEDFVNLDAQIKAMKQGREALKSAKAQMLAQVQPVDQASKTADMLDTLLQQNCSMAERLLKDEKERRRGEIVAAGVSALRAHIAALNVRLGRPFMPAVAADFGGCVKGLKSLASMEDKVSGELARAKIESNAIADRIDANLKHLAAEAGEYGALFPDLATVVLKDPQDFEALVQWRVAEHKAAEQKRADALAEQARERIRQQEAARIQREQREAQQEEDALIASLWANARRIEGDKTSYIRKAIGAFESGAKDWENDARPRVADAVAFARAEMRAKLDAAVAREQAAATAPVVAPSRALPAALVDVMPEPVRTAMRAPQAADSTPTLTLGQIGTRLGFSLSADFIRTLGFEPVKVKAAWMFREEQFDHICDALVAHVQSIQALQAA